MDTNNNIKEDMDTSAYAVNSGNMDSDEIDHDTAGLADPGPSHDKGGIVEEIPSGFRLHSILGSLVMSLLLVELTHFHARREKNLMILSHVSFWLWSAVE